MTRPRHILVQGNAGNPQQHRAEPQPDPLRHAPPNQHQQRRQYETSVGTDTDTLAEVITDLMDLSDLREAFWSNDLVDDALPRKSGAAGKSAGQCRRPSQAATTIEQGRE